MTQKNSFCDIFHFSLLTFHFSLRVPAAEVVVEQGEEKAAEGNGGNKTEGLRLTEHRLEGCKKGGAVIIANDSEPQQQAGSNGDDGKDLLAAFTCLPLTFNASG